MKFILFIFAIVFIVGCANSPTAPEQSFQINWISWVYINYPYDFFTSLPHYLGIEGSLHYSGVTISPVEGDSITYNGGNLTWKVPLTANNVNDSLSLISYSGWSQTLSINGSVMPIDTFNFEIKLKNGGIAKHAIRIPAPGMSQTNGFKYIYTEDYQDQIMPTFAPMIKRAVGVTGLKGIDTLTITFSTDDSMVYNGYLWFYNNANGYLGISQLFRNFSTLAVAGIINKGAGIFCDGAVNTVKVTKAEFTPYQGSSFTDIGFARVVLTDGRQYQSRLSSVYDCRSISTRFSIQ